LKKEKVLGLPDPDNEKLLKSVQLLHLQVMRLGVLKPYRKSMESMRPTMKGEIGRFASQHDTDAAVKKLWLLN